MNTLLARIAALSLARALALSALTFAAPMAAQSAPREPVVINGILASPANPDDGGPGRIQVAFRNEAAVTATSVLFRISDSEGNQTRIDDVGTFSPGALVKHTFSVPRLGDNGTAQVVEVQFADGSTWDSSTQQQGLTRRQAADEPQHLLIQQSL